MLAMKIPSITPTMVSPTCTHTSREIGTNPLRDNTCHDWSSLKYLLLRPPILALPPAAGPAAVTW